MSSEVTVSKKTVWTVVSIAAGTIILLIVALLVLFGSSPSSTGPSPILPTASQETTQPTQETTPTDTAEPVPTETSSSTPTPTPTPTPTSGPKVQPADSTTLDIEQWDVTTWVPNSLGSVSYEINGEQILFTSEAANSLSCTGAQSGWGWQRSATDPGDGSEKIGDFWYTALTGTECSADSAGYTQIASAFQTMFDSIHS